jgi:uncharacterized protein (DUF1697 family)
MISLLRAVNLAGYNKVRMDALRLLYESLGLRDVQTYIQSGNVIFRTGARDNVRLAIRIEQAIERSFGFRSSVVVRSVAELREVIQRNPFAAQAATDPSKLLVTFLATEPTLAARDKTAAIAVEPEEIRIDGRHLYVYFPNGMGRSKLSPNLIEKTLGAIGTGRNWNTVTKLLELAEKLEAGR